LARRGGAVAGRVAGLHFARAHAAPDGPGAAQGDAGFAVLLQPRSATGQAGVDGAAPDRSGGSPGSPGYAGGGLEIFESCFQCL